MSIKITYTRTEENGYENLQFGEFKDLQTLREWIFEDDLLPKFSSNEPYKLEPIEFEDYKGRTYKINVIEDASEGGRKTIFYTGTGVSHYVICTQEMAIFLEACNKQKNKYKENLKKALRKNVKAEEENEDD